MAEKTMNSENNALATCENKSVAETRDTDNYLVPAVDIYETEEGLTLVADVPGASQDGIDVNVEDGLLTIKAKAEHTLREGNYYREYDLMNYWRQFRLSDQVDTEKITAHLEHGVLTLNLPKAEKMKPRKIEVKLG